MTKEEISFFDTIAPSWDGMERLSTPGKVNEILDIIGVEKGMDVLDLGTGTGVLLPFLSERIGSEGHILAVDISEGMLSQAYRKFGGRDNIVFLLSDFEEQSLEGRYDLIFLYCVYPHLHYPAETLHRLIDNNLKPGGRIIIGFPTDENFINNIHGRRKVGHDILPKAEILVLRLVVECLRAKVIANDSEKYLVEVRQ